jgi:uncharacterized RDD family membrane protein YckC
VSNDEEHVLQGLTAGFVTRLLAYVIDMIVVAAIVVLGGWIAALVDDTIARVGLTVRIELAAIYIFLIPFIIGLYYVVFWSLTGRTIGKWLMGLKVVGANGRPPTIGRSLIRVIGYGLSAILFWAGYLWVIIDDERQAWHDHMARTWVVYDYERRTEGETYEDYLAETGNL